MEYGDTTNQLVLLGSVMGKDTVAGFQYTPDDLGDFNLPVNAVQAVIVLQMKVLGTISSLLQ